MWPKRKKIIIITNTEWTHKVRDDDQQIIPLIFIVIYSKYFDILFITDFIIYYDFFRILYLPFVCFFFFFFLHLLKLQSEAKVSPSSNQS